MFRVTLINNETKETVSCVEYGEWDEMEEFIWTEGNHACDCNRAAFFNRAKVIDHEWDESPCGDDKYSIVSIELEDGTKLDGVE